MSQRWPAATSSSCTAPWPCLCSCWPMRQGCRGLHRWAAGGRVACASSVMALASAMYRGGVACCVALVSTRRLNGLHLCTCTDALHPKGGSHRPQARNFLTTLTAPHRVNRGMVVVGRWSSSTMVERPCWCVRLSAECCRYRPCRPPPSARARAELAVLQAARRARASSPTACRQAARTASPRMLPRACGSWRCVPTSCRSSLVGGGRCACAASV